jgi:hypothetical protein
MIFLFNIKIKKILDLLELIREIYEDNLEKKSKLKSLIMN